MTENEKKQTQRIKAKQKCVKILNICCYIGTILLVLLLLLTGLTQCKGASSASAEAEQPLVTDLSLTTWRLNDTIDVSEDYAFDINFEDEYSINQSWHYTGFNISNGSLIYWESNGGRTIAYDEEDRFIDTPEAQTISIIDGDDVGNGDFIRYLYANATLLTDINYFEFNKTFNYNAPMGASLGSPYGAGANWTYSGSDTAYIQYDLGVFISNGQQFKYIRWRAQKTDGLYVKMPTYLDSDKIQHAPTGSWSFLFLEYVTADNQTYIACSRNQVAFTTEGGGYAYYQDNSVTWRNDAYRYLTLYESLAYETNRVALNAFNNNNQYTPAEIGTGDANVFNLFANVFTAIAPILSIMILPNITIGMLVFIPLVAALIFFIIHIIKK